MTKGELKQIRLSMSLTQSELAKLLHIDRMTVSRWERGIMIIPEYMAELLGYKAREQLTPDYFEKLEAVKEKQALLYNTVNNQQHTINGLVGTLADIIEKIKRLDVKVNPISTLAYNINHDVLILEIDYFDIRTMNCLLGENITTVGELCGKTKNDLFKIPNLGKKSFTKIIDYLASVDLKLKD